jgi:hypothetical protein
LAALLALLAAVAFAFGTVLQQKGTLETDAEEGDPRFLVQILRRPVWALGALLTSWTPYVLLGSAIVGFVLQQSALKTGALAPAMAASSAVTLLGSVILGTVLFGEALSGGRAGLILATPAWSSLSPESWPWWAGKRRRVVP